MSKCQKSSGSNVTSVQCSECQSGKKKARVNGRSNHDVFVFLVVRCTAERRDHRYLKVFFRYVGNGTRLALQEYGLAEHSGCCHLGARPDRLWAHRRLLPIARATLVSTFVTSRPSTISSFYLLKQFATGKPCVICQDMTCLVEFPLRAGIGARCVRAEGSRSLV